MRNAICVPQRFRLKISFWSHRYSVALSFQVNSISRGNDVLLAKVANQLLFEGRFG